MTEQRKLTSADKEKERIKKVLEKVIIKKLRDAHLERDRQIDIEEMLKFYRTPPSTEVPQTERADFKDGFKSVFESIVTDEVFVMKVFDYDLFLKLNETEYMGRILTIMKDCAIELFNKMIEEKLKWNFNMSYKDYIAIACLLIAIKNIGTQDWLNDDNIIFSEIMKTLNKINGTYVEFSLEICEQIEIDILKITGWKGCNVYDLKKDYTDYFKYTETKDKFDIPDKTISSELSEAIKEIIAEEEKEKEEEKAKKKAAEDSKPKRLPLPLPKNMPKKSPSPKSKKMSKSPSPKSLKKSPSPKSPKKSPSPKPRKKSPSPKSPKKSPSPKSAFKKKKKV